MSLNTPPVPKQYRLGIVASCALDDPDFLTELISDKAPSISHIYTNGANKLVSDFAAAAGIPCTTFPLTGGRSLPWSTSHILDNAEFVYIVADPASKSAVQVALACEARKVKHRLVPYTPYTHWAEKAGKVSQILAALSPDDLAANETLKAIRKAI